MEEGFNIAWDDGPNVGHLAMCEEVVVQDMEDHQINDENNGLMYIQEGDDDEVVYMNSEDVIDQNQEIVLTENEYIECQVAEEVISDDWVQPDGDERVEIVGDFDANKVEGGDEIDIPLPTDQDEYTTSRPYPCDFCSRRFRKKANLMNHMVAHQTDRPHGCNLCGARYIRKCDLMNHLKIHAYVPEPEEYEEPTDSYQPEYQSEYQPEDSYQPDETTYQSENERYSKKKKKDSKKKKIKIKKEFDEGEKVSQSRSYDYVDEDMRLLTEMANSSARTIEYGAEYVENHPVSEPRYPIVDPRKPFVCQHCGVGFAREKALASHARIHGGDSPFECETCNDMFWDIGLLKEHVRIKHGGVHETVDPYDDDEDEDYIEEEDERYGDYFCTTCGMTFHRQDLLRRHSRIHVKEEYVNESEFGHVCNVCGDSFAEALDLLAHAEVHARLDIHRCMLCGESFAQEEAMAQHIAQRHAKTMPANSCSLCGKTCKDRRTLLKHSWEHTREKAFPCSKCGKGFHNKARLRRHMLSHRNKSVTCTICGEDFPDGRTLMNHRHSHTNMSGRQFPCRECGKTFGSRSSQQIHIRIHTGERPYGCRFCWKAFADGGTLRKHERIHTGEKPYACAVCPRAFNQRVVLREHIRSHHSGPDPKYGTSMTPFCCTVCGDLFATSPELIVHLIEHCDLNTAMKRQPQVGPRKYKRRRKLKPHELERLSTSQMDNLDDGQLDEENNMTINHGDHNNDLLSDSDDNMPSKRKLGKKNKRGRPPAIQPVEDNYESVFQSFETAVQTINNIVNSKPTSTRGRKKKVQNDSQSQQQNQANLPSRPKMIHTQKTRVPIDSNDKVRHKTKTLITRTTPASMNNQLVDKLSDALRDKLNDRNRPRTKNVSYHVLLPEKYPTATFNEDDDLQNDGQNHNMKIEQTEFVKLESGVRDEGGMRRDDVDMNLDHMFYDDVNNYSNGNVQEEILEDGDVEHDEYNDQFQLEENIELSEEVVPEVENEEVYIGHDELELDHEETEHQEAVPMNIIQIIRGNGTNNLMATSQYDESVLPTMEDEEIEPEPGELRGINDDEEQEEEDMAHEYFLSDDQQQFNVKMEPQDQQASSLYELAELSMQHAQNKFKCEMCSATFSDRGQLLLHVPVHI